MASRFCGVSMVPGRMQLTLIPLAFSSAAMLSVRRITAAFEALYAAEFLRPCWPAGAAVWMILPLPCRSMTGTTARPRMNAVRALSASMKSNVSSGVSWSGSPARKPPTVFASTSIRLNCSITRLTICRVAASSVRSTPPSSRCSGAAARSAKAARRPSSS